MNACIVLNGEAPSRNFFLKETKGTVVIAADGGLKVCKRYGVSPAYIIGDFDSLSSRMLARYQKSSSVLKDENQDTTDFQKALRLASRLGAKQITVLGGFGKDADHEFANILSLPKHAVMKNEKTSAFLARRVAFQVSVGSIVSVIAISEVSGLSYSGLQWSAPRGKLNPGWIGIRNRALRKRVTISASRGTFAVITHAS
jgi:thiamine pyrophosphokinase